MAAKSKGVTSSITHPVPQDNPSSGRAPPSALTGAV
jgi:hypothetical protein